VLDVLPGAIGERLDGLWADAVDALVAALTEATLHGFGDLDGEERGVRWLAMT